MSLIQFQIPEENITLPQLANLVAIIMKELQWAINGNLDVKNVRANSITAKALDVDELSAISANLGKVVAGILVGAYIATADGIYPRVELSSTGNLLAALFDATHALNIIPSLGGTPGLSFVSPTGATNIIKGAFFTISAEIDILLTSRTNVHITAGTSGTGKVDITSPGGIIINGISSLAGTKVYYVSDTSGGATTRKLTFTDGILTKET